MGENWKERAGYAKIMLDGAIEEGLHRERKEK